MKPAPFDYYCPASLEEALQLLGKYGEECKVLAGGQSLIPLLNMRLVRPAVIIDINRLPGLDDVREAAAGLTVGALARQRAVERSPATPRTCPLLVEALRHVGHPAIRNRGTVGGSLVHADPAAELPAVLVAIEGVVKLRSEKRERIVPAAAFFKDLLTTDIHADELLIEVLFPRQPNIDGNAGFAFIEVSRRYGDFALVGVTALLALGAGGKVHDVRLAFIGVDPTPFRGRKAEAVMNHQVWSEPLLTEAAEAAIQGMDPPSDLHASAKYRLRLVKVLTKRALTTAYRRAVSEPQ